jgi:SAM-dependent methyltransferase
MVDHKLVYQQEGDTYQSMIAREDYQENLVPAILNIINFENLDVVDLGSGTGRLASLILPTVRSVYAFDLSIHMLRVAVGLFNSIRGDSWVAAAADHRAIPLSQKSVDLVLSGWSFCYLVVWEGMNWEAALLKGLKEIKRVLRRRGMVILIETLGTGVQEPQPPDKLKPYFDYLEALNFKRTWIRTDYKFANLNEAHKLVKFFFGEEMLPMISQDAEPILPECTGIWWIQENNL